MKTPESDICSGCKEHCEFEQLNELGEHDSNEEYLSNCCSLSPYSVDAEYERD